MEEENYNVNLADMNDIFDNKTLRYRINGFAYACGMKDINITGESDLLVGSRENNEYFISVNKSNSLKFNMIKLSGNYGDLNFSFVNYYNKEKLDKKIVNLPFSIKLIKVVDSYSYELNVETVEKYRTKFSIHRYCEFKDRTLTDNISFYANVLEFSEILKLTKAFIYNPKLVFNTYNEIMEQKKVVFTNSDLNKGLMQDEKLDAPAGKIKKLFRRCFN